MARHEGLCCTCRTETADHAEDCRVTSQPLEGNTRLIFDRCTDCGLGFNFRPREPVTDRR